MFGDPFRQGNEVFVTVFGAIKIIDEDGNAGVPLQAFTVVAGFDDDHLAVDVSVIGLPVNDLQKTELDEVAKVGVTEVVRLIGASDKQHWVPPGFCV
jgi:hypothetical protein